MWTSANYPHRPNLYFPSPILKYPLYTNARMELICFNFGPLRWEYAFSKLSADHSFASYWSQSSNSFASRLWYLGRCILLNFLSQTRRIWRAVSVASLCINFISKYVGSCPRPEARRLSPFSSLQHYCWCAWLSWMRFSQRVPTCRWSRYCLHTLWTAAEAPKHVIEAVEKWVLSLLQAGKVVPSSFEWMSANQGHGYMMIEGRVPAPVVWMKRKDLATDSIFTQV